MHLALFCEEKPRGTVIRRVDGSLSRAFRFHFRLPYGINKQIVSKIKHKTAFLRSIRVEDFNVIEY